MSEPIRAVTMPKWGIEMQEGTIAAWHHDVGADIDKGAELVDIETEKIVNTLEAPAAGRLRRRLADVGDTLPVGALLGVLADAGVGEDAIEQFVRDFVPADAAFEADKDTAAPAAEPAASSGAAAAEQRISPIARRLAGKLGVDLGGVRGTGRNGRISKEDVEAAARAQGKLAGEAASTNPHTVQRFTSARKTIARRLVEAKTTIPHFYLSADLAIDALERRRAALRERHPDVALSLNDLLVRASALALIEVPEVNVQVHGDEIHQFRHADIAVAVASERGLLTPVLRNADQLGAIELAGALRGLIERARSGRLSREELDGGTFSVSNLGMHGIREFAAVINPPHGAILAIGAAAPRVVAVDGKPAVARIAAVTLSCDHRAIDGELGARFLAALARIVAAPPDAL